MKVGEIFGETVDEKFPCRVSQVRARARSDKRLFLVLFISNLSRHKSWVLLCWLQPTCSFSTNVVSTFLWEVKKNFCLVVSKTPLGLASLCEARNWAFRRSVGTQYKTQEASFLLGWISMAKIQQIFLPFFVQKINLKINQATYKEYIKIFKWKAFQ